MSKGTKVDVIKAAEMRENGATYEEIAKAFGVTRQCVWLALGKKRRNQKLYDDIPYKGFYEYFKENPRLNFGNFCYKVFGYSSKKNEQKYRNLLTNNVEVKLSISEIKKIIAYTGKTFEELFAERWFTDEQ